MALNPFVQELLGNLYTRAKSVAGSLLRCKCGNWPLGLCFSCNLPTCASCGYFQPRLLSCICADCIGVKTNKPTPKGAKSPYAVLGLKDETPLEVVKKKYKKLARKYHPDAPGGGDAAKFREIQTAYDAIMKDET